MTVVSAMKPTDIRIVEKSAKFGVFCRRFGVPLIDGGTIRLPRLIGKSNALYMIITGNEINSNDAYRIGLANIIVNDGDSLNCIYKLIIYIL